MRDGQRRAALRRALRHRYPWLDRDDVGPRAVRAGECDRCGAEPRLVEGCGPGAYRYLGRRCAQELGTAAWCAGHATEARRLMGWLAGLPATADDVARLWWVATGEVRLDPELATRWPSSDLPGAV